MLFWIYFWVYTLIMLFIWWFFIIARIHSLKFKNYQPKIVHITKIITIVLWIFTILGYILIFSLWTSPTTYDIKDTVKQKSEIEDNIDNFSDISEKDSIIPNDAGEDYY